MLMSAVQEVLEDKGVKVESAVAIKARDVAAKLMEWSRKRENEAAIAKFSDELIAKLQEVFVGTVRSTGSIIDRDKLWKHFFKIRSAADYREKWDDFLHPISGETSSCALFYQHVTEIIFKSLIRSHFQISSASSTYTATINEHEKNALRYAAGYVCCHIRSKIEKSSHALKEELLLSLMAMVKGKGCTGDIGMAEEWTDMLDRGVCGESKKLHFTFFVLWKKKCKYNLNSCQQVQVPEKR